MKYAFTTGKSSVELSLLELRGLGVETATDGPLILGDILPVCSRLAYPQAAYTILLKVRPQQLKNELATPLTEPFKGSIRIRVQRLGGGKPDIKALVADLHRWCGSPKVDLATPDHDIVLLQTEKHSYVVEQVWQNKEPFEQRKNQYRPAPHPTSMHPKLARALINMTHATKEVADPFCGSGGILIEAGLMGLSCIGVDIDQKMINRAQINLAHFNLNAEFHTKDCLRFHKTVEAIVTDLPYGKNSTGKDPDRLAESFISHATTLTSHLVMGYCAPLPKFLFHKAGWQITHVFSLPLHKTLTKYIYILTR